MQRKINRFKTKGFENHVGTRVDGWFLAETGAQWIENSTEEVEGSIRYIDFEYIFLVMPNFKLNTTEHRNLSGVLSDKIQLIPSKYEGDINSIVDLKPMWPTS